MARIFISYAREDFKPVKELHQRLRYLIPVLLEFVETEEIPDKLREIGWVFLYEEDGWDELLRALTHGVEQRGIQTTQPSPTEPESNAEKLKPESARDISPAPVPLPSPPPELSSSLLTYDFTTFTLDARGEVVRRRQGKARYFREEIGDVDLEMTYVPGGEFAMGTNAAEIPEVRKEIERYWKEGGHWEDTEQPQHEVAVPPFFMGKFQVTQAQWRTVARWPKISTDLTLDPSNFKGDLLPVESVSWEPAQEFCARLAKKTGKPYRLPSEAEWEYACRAGTLTPFAFGETITPEVVNYNGDYPYAGMKKGVYRSKTTPIGSLGVANAFGLFDMHGNVSEWCEDVWHDSYGGKHGSPPLDGSAWLTGGDSIRRVLRGGSWGNVGRNCRSANRNYLIAGNHDSGIGFRVVLSSRTR